MYAKQKEKGGGVAKKLMMIYASVGILGCPLSVVLFNTFPWHSVVDLCLQ